MEAPEEARQSWVLNSITKNPSVHHKRFRVNGADLTGAGYIEPFRMLAGHEARFREQSFLWHYSLLAALFLPLPCPFPAPKSHIHV